MFKTTLAFSAIILFAVVFALTIVALAATATKDSEDSSTQRVQAPASTPRSSAPQVALISASCNFKLGYRQCTGFVKNLTDKPIDNVTVVISWFDSAGTARDSDEALISYTPLLAGQQSPWSTTAPSNPELDTFSVGFKEFLGGSLRMRDDRPD